MSKAHSPRKTTRFAPCANHQGWASGVTKRRLAENWVEGGPLTSYGPCSPEGCQVFPGTDFYNASSLAEVAVIASSWSVNAKPVEHKPVIHFVAPVPGSGYGGCGGLGCSCGFKPSEPSRADYSELDAHLVAEGLPPSEGYFPGTEFGPPFSETFSEEKRAWQQASGVQMRCRHCSEIGTYQELAAHAAIAHPEA